MATRHDVFAPLAASGFHTPHHTLDRCRLRCHLAEGVRDRWEFDGSDGLADLARQTDKVDRSLRQFAGDRQNILGDWGLSRHVTYPSGARAAL